jgi:CRISPR system Cascade subunit CasA
MCYSVVDDPLIRVQRTDETVQECTLPQVLALLVEGRVLAFEALQPHQQQPWFSFLVQLAAMGVAREANGEIPKDAAAWRAVLVGLAGGSEAAWHLVVEDVSRPAFMQPPVPEGSLDDANYKDDVPSPDQLDMLITSKNHDVKAQRVTKPRLEHWLFALCTLQTMEGFLGRGNYGVVRMNGGFGNRPQVSLTASLAWGERFRRDLGVLLDERDALAERYDVSGHALLWLDPWDGAKGSGLPLGDCDPYFIEICRRIRFSEDDGVITCWRANTKAQRVDAPDALNGRTGDPWTPIEKDGAKALTLGEAGFTYERLQSIFLSGEYARPAALEFQESERSGAYLVARTLVRGQGKTDGLHHRVIPVSAKVSGRLFNNPEEERERLGRRAGNRVERAADVQREVLYPAIAALLSSGRDDADVDWEQAAPWIDAFDRAIDARFFESLWASVDQGEEEAAADWQNVLREEAEKQFENAKRSTPIAAIHRWHAVSKAQSIFEGGARRVLDRAFD